MAVVLDSAVIVAFLDRGDALHSAADAAIRELIDGHRLYVSVVTFSEVLTSMHRLGDQDEAIVRGFFADLVSEILPFDEIYSDRAARLRAENLPLRLPEAIVLAAADVHPDIEVLLTGDAAMASVEGLDCRVDLLRPAA